MSDAKTKSLLPSSVGISTCERYIQHRTLIRPCFHVALWLEKTRAYNISCPYLGRGGEGNKTTIGEDERASSKSPARNGGGGRRRSSMKDQAKEMLGFGRGEKDKRQENAVAIEDD